MNSNNNISNVNGQVCMTHDGYGWCQNPPVCVGPNNYCFCQLHFQLMFNPLCSLCKKVTIRTINDLCETCNDTKMYAEKKNKRSAMTVPRPKCHICHERSAMEFSDLCSPCNRSEINSQVKSEMGWNSDDVKKTKRILADVNIESRSRIEVSQSKISLGKRQQRTEELLSEAEDMEKVVQMPEPSATLTKALARRKNYVVKSDVTVHQFNQDNVVKSDVTVYQFSQANIQSGTAPGNARAQSNVSQNNIGDSSPPHRPLYPTIYTTLYHPRYPPICPPFSPVDNDGSFDTADDHNSETDVTSQMLPLSLHSPSNK